MWRGSVPVATSVAPLSERGKTENTNPQVRRTFRGAGCRGRTDDVPLTRYPAPTTVLTCGFSSDAAALARTVVVWSCQPRVNWAPHVTHFTLVLGAGTPPASMPPAERFAVKEVSGVSHPTAHRAPPAPGLHPRLEAPRSSRSSGRGERPHPRRPARVGALFGVVRSFDLRTSVTPMCPGDTSASHRAVRSVKDAA